MALQGSLDTLALDDVIRLLAGTTKTGRLRLDGPGGGGSLWFAEGAVIGGEVSEGPAMPAAHALFELWRSEADRFEFVPGEVVPDAGDAVDADALLAEAESRLARWEALVEVVPSVDASVALVAELGADEVSITRDRWRLLTVVAASSTVGQVGDALTLDGFEVRQSIGNLVDAGLVELGEPPAVEPPAVVPPTVDLGAPVEDDPVVVAEPFRPAEPADHARSDVAPAVDTVAHRYLTGQATGTGSTGFGGLPEPLPVGAAAPAAPEALADDGRDPFAHAPVETEPSRATGGWDPFGPPPRAEDAWAQPAPPADEARYDPFAPAPSSTAPGRDHLDQPVSDELPSGPQAQGSPGFDRAGFDQPGFDRPAFDRAGFDQPAFEQPVFDPAGFDQPAFDQPAFDRAGFDRPELERDDPRPEPEPVPAEPSRTWWGGTR